MILRECDTARQKELRRIFEKEPFGELERLVTRKLLDVARGVASEELRSEEWLRHMAQLSGRSYEQMRVAVLEFLDTDVFSVSAENCLCFLDPIIDSWEIDLMTFGTEVVLNCRLAATRVKRFMFAEQEPQESFLVEPGLDKSLSGDATEGEIEFLKAMRFKESSRPRSIITGSCKTSGTSFIFRPLRNAENRFHGVVRSSPGG